MALGAVLSCAFNWLTSWGAGFWTLALPWALNGWAQSMGFAPATRLIAAWWAPRERGRAFGVFNFAAGFSSIVTYATAALVLAWLSWRWVFRLPVLLLCWPAALVVAAPDPGPPRGPRLPAANRGMAASSLVTDGFRRRGRSRSCAAARVTRSGIGPSSSRPSGSASRTGRASASSSGCPPTWSPRARRGRGRLDPAGAASRHGARAPSSGGDAADRYPRRKPSPADRPRHSLAAGRDRSASWRFRRMAGASCCSSWRGSSCSARSPRSPRLRRGAPGNPRGRRGRRLHERGRVRDGGARRHHDLGTVIDATGWTGAVFVVAAVACLLGAAATAFAGVAARRPL